MLQNSASDASADSGNTIKLGFSENDNNEPHVVLANIKERLEMMCGGTLTISSRENDGTTVEDFLPKQTE